MRYVLVVDAGDRPLGWIARDDIPADGAMTEAWPTRSRRSSNKRTTLKDALSMMLDADVQSGHRGRPDGRLQGLLTVDAIAEQDARRRARAGAAPIDELEPSDRAEELGARSRPSAAEAGAGPDALQAAPLVDWGWILDHLDDIVRGIDPAPPADDHPARHRLRHRARPGRLGGPPAAGLRADRRPTAGILYTIPSLAAFAILRPIFGLSLLTAIIPLATYTLLILFRNNVAGFHAVPTDVLEAADGMGYTRASDCVRVELPLAVPLIMAGVRLAERDDDRPGHRRVGPRRLVRRLGQFITEGLQTLLPDEVSARGGPVGRAGVRGGRPLRPARAARHALGARPGEAR